MIGLNFAFDITLSVINYQAVTYATETHISKSHCSLLSKGMNTTMKTRTGTNEQSQSYTL